MTDEPVTWDDIERLALTEPEVHMVLMAERRGDLTRLQALMEMVVLLTNSRKQTRASFEEHLRSATVTYRLPGQPG